jgi:hypothetical protein
MSPFLCFLLAAADAPEFEMGDITDTHYTMENLFSVTGDRPCDELIRAPVGYDEDDGPYEELLQYILQVRIIRLTAFGI